MCARIALESGCAATYGMSDAMIAVISGIAGR